MAAFWFWSDAYVPGADEDCRSHRVDWRAEALAARARIEAAGVIGAPVIDDRSTEDAEREESVRTRTLPCALCGARIPMRDAVLVFRAALHVGCLQEFARHVRLAAEEMELRNVDG